MTESLSNTINPDQQLQQQTLSVTTVNPEINGPSSAPLSVSGSATSSSGNGRASLSSYSVSTANISDQQQPSDVLVQHQQQAPHQQALQQSPEWQGSGTSRPQYHHTTSFPLVSNNHSKHLFPLLPNPTAAPASPAPQTPLTNAYAAAQAAAAAHQSHQQQHEQHQQVENRNPSAQTHPNPDHHYTRHHPPPQDRAVHQSSQPSSSQPYLINRDSLESMSNSNSNSNSSATEAVSNSVAATNDEEFDKSNKSSKTLRYNWTDYEDRLLLKIVLSNHRILFDLKNKPLKRFWELVADAIGHYSVNSKISRTHRQCRERFYILYSKAMKFAEQLGVDPSQGPRRSSQGLSFTELEELYLKILQVLRLVDGFKLVVNEAFYNDPLLVEEFDRSVALASSMMNQVQEKPVGADETTLSISSSRSGASDDPSEAKQSPQRVINNLTSSKHRITPLMSSAAKPQNSSTDNGHISKRKKFSAHPYTTSSESVSNVVSSGNENANVADSGNSMPILNKPGMTSVASDTAPITRLDNKSFSSLSSGGVSTRPNAEMGKPKPNSFLKNKKQKPSSTIDIKHHPTNVDESSNNSSSSLGSTSNSSNSQGENDNKSDDEEGDCDEDDARDDEEGADDVVIADKKPNNKKFMDRSAKPHHHAGSMPNDEQINQLAERIDHMDYNIADLRHSISGLDTAMKVGLNDAFDRIAKFQTGINDNINMIVSQLKHNIAINKQSEENSPQLNEKDDTEGVIKEDMSNGAKRD